LCPDAQLIGGATTGVGVDIGHLITSCRRKALRHTKAGVDTDAEHRDQHGDRTSSDRPQPTRR
jgi:hypothetical protein